MKKIHFAAIAAVLLASSYPVLGAETAGEKVKDAASATGNAVKNGAEATGHAVKGAAEKTGDVLGMNTGKPEMATAAEVAEYKASRAAVHEMTGKITSVDHKDGAIDLKTDLATLNVRVAPKATQNLKEDQQATVKLALVKLPLDKGGTRAYDQPSKGTHKGMHTGHWMKGTVGSIDHQTGVFNFKTGTASLRLHFPPDKISNLNDGDNIAVAMSLTHPSKKAL